MRPLAYLALALFGCSNETYDGLLDGSAVQLVDAGASCTAESRLTESPVEGPGNRVVRQTIGEDGATFGVVTWQWIVPGSAEYPDHYTFTVTEPAPLGKPLRLIDACIEGAEHCWTLETNVAPDASSPTGYQAAQFFYPDEGTVTLLAVGPSGTGRFTASFRGGKFFHYAASSAGYMPANDYEVCTTELPPELEVDLPIEASDISPPGKKRFR
jgi:hypothetical protein